MNRHFKYIIVPLLILASLINSYAQKTDYIKLPHLTNKESFLLSDKCDKEFFYSGGDLIFHTTEGEYKTEGECKLNELLIKSNSSLTHQDKFEICIAILCHDNLYHLHDRAASEIYKIINITNISKYVNQEKIDYILLRTNIQLSQILYPGGHFVELDKEHIDKFLNMIKSDKLQFRTKKFFIESLYSLCISEVNGKYIYDMINKFDIATELKNYNDNLFKAYQLLKPNFERLKNIRTWMEMDKNYIAIHMMFKYYHPIMFMQLLSFNPSTVLESKEICNLKQNALIGIIKNADTTSFYNTYRLIYLTELLIEENYTVRFLDQVMDEKGKKDLVDKFELKKH